ncbi:retropepsin-like aspartic protease [Flavobacterium sp. I3-2]|uniref:retropepsin-like aspartic protease n=1 Tax=Flavobacterium sp. I3-2 TaxID=2748319 RepID=UPI0015B14A60|nr:retropepsin-like aspartic protease [Flavobacterium sp. I3-2]
MTHLETVLKQEKYKKIKFKISNTKHLLIKASLNGIVGDFILDTGASTTCIDFSGIEYFNIVAQNSSATASGAGAIGMETQVSKNNLIKLGSWKTTEITLVIFDLSHVNTALTDYKAKTVHGIIGADILEKGFAVIDYKNQLLFLK